MEKEARIESRGTGYVLETLPTKDLLRLIGDISEKMVELSDLIEQATQIIAERDYEEGLF